MTSRAFVEAAKLSLAAAGVVASLAAVGGVAFAQAPELTQSAPAAAAPAAGAPASAVLDKGRQIFTDYGCAQCHSLSDAGATGHVGPSLDGNPNITQEFVKQRVTDGQGMMPSFASQLSPDEINAVATYIAKVATK